MSFDLTIGLGTAAVLVVLAVLLLRGRFGTRPGHAPGPDPAERWLRAETSETPPARDRPTHAHADDPGDADEDGDADADGGADGGGTGP